MRGAVESGMAGRDGAKVELDIVLGKTKVVVRSGEGAGRVVTTGRTRRVGCGWRKNASMVFLSVEFFLELC